jgi:acetylornithine deacetylase/succinyl-diaminopimelate desuccinylase-like protein
VAIPSVAFPGYPPEPVHQMAGEALRLFREAGFATAELQQVPAGYPAVYGEIPGPDGTPR